MKDELVTVFGGGGFLGRYVVPALLRNGARVRVAERRVRNSWYLKAQANLGQISWTAADITRPETLAHAVEGCSAVVNLVGSFADMDAIQHRGAGHVAAAAARAGARAMVHLSAIGADRDSASLYGRSKGQGEDAVRAALPSATILRPSVVFGREDAFINRFAGLIRMMPVVPVIGGKTRFQPVFAGDVARAVVHALGAPAAAGGAIFELGGPQVLTMREINEWIAARIGRDRTFVDVPDAVAGVLARATGWLPGAPITHDQWLMLQKDNVVAAGAAGLEALSIEPVPMDAVAAGWLVKYRKHGRFGALA